MWLMKIQFAKKEAFYSNQQVVEMGHRLLEISANVN